MKLTKQEKETLRKYKRGEWGRTTDLANARMKLGYDARFKRKKNKN